MLAETVMSAVVFLAHHKFWLRRREAGRECLSATSLGASEENRTEIWLKYCLTEDPAAAGWKEKRKLGTKPATVLRIFTMSKVFFFASSYMSYIC